MSGTASAGLTNDIRPSQAGITIDSETPTNIAQTATNQGQTATNQTACSGSSHNNVQPYVIAYMWKRTA